MNRFLFKYFLFCTILFYSILFSQTFSKTDSTENRTIIQKKDTAPVNFIDFCDFILSIPPTSWRTNFSPGSTLYPGVRGSLSSASNLNFNGINLNDPLTGRFNLHMLAPDLIRGIDISAHSDAFGNPNTMNLSPISVPEGRAYTRAMYNFNTGIESSLGITFAQPLLYSLRYLAGFSSRTYTNINDGTSNKYQNIFFSSHINISKNWNADYTILQSKGDIYLLHSMVVPGDTVILNNPKQKTTSTNHIIIIKNDSSALNPKITLHRLSGNFEYRDSASDEKHIIEDGALNLSFEAKTSVMHIPVCFGLEHLFRDAVVGDTLQFTYFRDSGYLLTNFKLFQKSKIFLKILPQISKNDRFYLGLWNQYRFDLKNSTMNIAATFSKLYRNPTLSEFSGLTIYNSEPPSSLFFNLSMLNNHYLYNNDLKPESVVSADLSLNYSKGTALKSFISLFTKKTADVILPEFSQQGVKYSNNGKEQFTGIESYARANILKYLGLISANTIFLKTVSTRLSPASITGNLGIFIKYKFFKDDINGILTASARYWSSYYMYDWNYGDYLNIVTVPDGIIFNIKALFTVMDYAHISLELTNISGIDPFISNIQYLPERSFRFRILWELFD